MQPASGVVLPWFSSVHWPTGACRVAVHPRVLAQEQRSATVKSLTSIMLRSPILKRASRADPEQALRVATSRAAAAAEAGTKAASRIFQDAQRLSPEHILRQTQQAAQHVFTRTRGALERLPKTAFWAYSRNTCCQRFALALPSASGTTQCRRVLVAGAAQQANAGLNGAAESIAAMHRHEPGASPAITMPAAAPSPQVASVPPVSLQMPAIHAAGSANRGVGRTTAEDAEVVNPVAYGAAAGHAEPPPAGASQVLASDADRVAGALSQSPAASRVGPEAELDAAAISTHRGLQAASVGGVTVGGQAPHASSGVSQAGDDLAPSIAAPSQTRLAISPLPPPEPASAPQPALAAQGVTPHSTAASEPEQLPPHTLTSPLAGAHAAARPHDGAEPRAAPVKRKPRERRVPSSPFGRVMGFAGLGASLVAGTVRDSVAGYFQPRPADGEQPASAVSAT